MNGRCQGAQDTLFLPVGLKLKARDEEIGQTWLPMAPAIVHMASVLFPHPGLADHYPPQLYPVESPCSRAVPALQNIASSLWGSHQTLISPCPFWAPACYSPQGCSSFTVWGGALPCTDLRLVSGPSSRFGHNLGSFAVIFLHGKSQR